MNRSYNLKLLDKTPEWDVVIIGGGASGLGIATDAANRGLKTLLLEKIDFAKGTSSRSTKLVHGGVRYLQNGGEAGGGGFGLNSETLSRFATALNDFNTQLATNIQNLQNTQFQITLNPTNINVNLTGTSFLEQLTSTLKQELFSFVGQEIAQHTVGPDGRLTKDNRRV